MKKLFVFAITTLLLAGCTSIANQQEPPIVRLATHDSFVISDDLIKSFEELSGQKLEIIRLGDTGSLTNQLVLTKNAPIADAVFGIDNTFLPVAQQNKILDAAPVEIDYSDVCFNYDIDYFQSNQITPPNTWEDLTDPSFKSLTVVTDPKLSSPGLAFLATTVSKFGLTADFTKYWSDLASNDLLVAGSWEDAYFVNFTRYGGTRPIVLSYASSPAAELDESGTPKTKALLDGCFRQIEYASVISGAENKKGAEALVTFLTSKEFQDSVAENMYVYPSNQSASVPESWSMAALPAASNLGAELDFQSDKETWLQKWQEAIGE